MHLCSVAQFCSTLCDPVDCSPQCSCLENPRDGGAWWAAVYGVAQSQTRLKGLSSSSSSSRLLCPWDLPGKNTGVSCHFLLQELFPTWGLNLWSCAAPALRGGFFITEPSGKPCVFPLDSTFSPIPFCVIVYIHFFCVLINIPSWDLCIQ